MKIHNLILSTLFLFPVVRANAELCDQHFRPQTTYSTKELDELFTKHVDELSPEQLAQISAHAQALDAPHLPINLAADAEADRIIGMVQATSKKVTARLLRNTQKGKIEVYDTAIIGVGGVHGGLLASVLQSLAPEARIIGIDAGNGTSRTFDNVFFHLNSSESLVKTDTPLPYSSTQLRDLMPGITGNVYPRARALANAKDFSLGSLDMDIVLGNKVVSAVYGDDDLYLVTLENGIQYKARTLVRATGYGKTLDSFLDEPSRELIQKTTAEFLSGNRRGIAISFDDFRQNLEGNVDDLDVIIVGGKDGGSVVAEALTKKPVRGKRIWLGQKGSTGKEYLEAIENDKRYGDLAPRIDNKQLVPINAYLASVRHVYDGNGVRKLEVTYKYKDGKEEKVIGDLVILSTGYEKVADFTGGLQPQYFANDFDPELPGVWEITKKREAEFAAKNPQQKRAAPRFYSVGVDASVASGLFSLSRGGGLTVQVAKAIAEDVKYMVDLLPLTQAPGVRTQSTKKLAPASSKSIKESKIALAGVKSRLSKASRTFKFTGDLRLSIRTTGDSTTLTIDDLAAAGAELLLRKLTSDPIFMGYVRDLSVEQRALTLSIPRTSRGGLRMDKAIVGVD